MRKYSFHSFMVARSLLAAAMTVAAYRHLIAAPPRDRLDLFLAAANRLGAPVGHVEKDFRVCWSRGSLYRE